MFENYVWQCNPTILNWSEIVVRKIIDKNTKGWVRKGSWMEHWKGGRRIAVAPHKGGLAIYFSSQDVSPSMYKEMGGICPTGKCVIRVPFQGDYDLNLLKYIIGKYL